MESLGESIEEALTTPSNPSLLPRPFHYRRTVRKKRSTRRADKDYGDYEKGDLEAAAQDEHDAPVGTFVGEGRVKKRDQGDDGVS